MDLPQLRDFIVAHFDGNELRDLCFNLGIDYESLPGEGEAAKARELVAYCQRRDRLAELEAACLRLRPEVSNAPFQPVPPPPSDLQTAPPQPQDQFKNEQSPLVQTVTPFGKRVSERLVKVLRDPLWQGIGAIIGIIALLVAIASLQPNSIAPPIAPPTFTATPSKTPTKTPTPTPTPTPAAVVKAFSVMRGTDHSIVTPKETVNVTPGESIRIRAEVSANVDRNELVFTWHTCRRKDEIVKWGNGVFEIPYEAPDVTGPDCIQVKVEKGGALLDDSTIFVNVQQ